MYALFDQLFPRQQELHADLEVAVLDRVTESVGLGPYALRVGQCRIDVPLWTPPLPPRRGNGGWSPYGAPRLQPVAIGGKCDAPKNGLYKRNRCRGLRPVA
jgi:hypothetical protein